MGWLCGVLSSHFSPRQRRVKGMLVGDEYGTVYHGRWQQQRASLHETDGSSWVGDSDRRERDWDVRVYKATLIPPILILCLVSENLEVLVLLLGM